MPVNVVTLLVNPEEAERLTLASTEGKIQLALRNPLDKDAPSTPRHQAGGLLGYRAAHARRAVTARVPPRRRSCPPAAARRSADR